MPGYDTHQELRVLQTKGVGLDPDVVVVLFCLNDIHVVSTQLDDIERLTSARQNRLYRSRLAQFVARTTYAGRIDPIGDHETQLLSRLASLPNTYPSFMYRERERLGRTRHAFRRLGGAGAHRGVRKRPGLGACHARTLGVSCAHAFRRKQENLDGLEVILKYPRAVWGDQEPMEKASAGVEKEVSEPEGKVAQPEGKGSSVLEAPCPYAYRAA